MSQPALHSKVALLLMTRCLRRIQGLSDQDPKVISGVTSATRGRLNGNGESARYLGGFEGEDAARTSGL